MNPFIQQMPGPMLGENRDRWTEFLTLGSTQTFGETGPFSSWLHHDELSAIMGVYVAEEHSGNRRYRQQAAPNKSLEGIGKERGVK